jgi:hypothetical protein
MFAVSEDLFGLIVEEHGRFLDSWGRNKIHPQHELQKTFWESYLKTDPYNIKRGFLDASHVPTWHQFPVAKKIGEAAYRFHANLEAKCGFMIGRRASIRVYRDWQSAIRQITFTLKSNLQRRGILIGSHGQD